MGQKNNMKDINKVTLVGRIAIAPELKSTPNDNRVCRFVLATNRSWTLENGNKESVAQFHTLIAWNKLAEIIFENTKKGDKLYAEGRVEYRKYTDKNGVERSVTEIVLSDISLIEAAPVKEAAEQSTEPIDEVTNPAGQAPETTPTSAEDDEMIS